MRNRSSNTKILIRLIFWLIYFFAGYVLFSKKTISSDQLISFARIFYPFSIFWLQIRFTSKEKWLPVDSSMSTAQLWFRILPILGSLISFGATLINFLLFLLSKFN